MKPRRSCRSALAVAIGTALFLLFGTGALRVIGDDGDRADLMFLVVLAIGVVGGVVTRPRARGMARTMTATAVSAWRFELAADRGHPVRAGSR